MNIVVDGFPLIFRRAGIGRYTYELLLQFSTAVPRPAVHVANFGLSLRRARLPGRLGPADLSAYLGRNRANAILFCALPRVVRDRVTAPQAAAAGCDVYFAPNFLGVYGRSFRTVITIHDMGYHLYPEYTQPAMLKALRANLPRHAGRADGIVTDSESTKRDIVKILGIDPAKIVVVPLAAGGSDGRAADPAAGQRVRARYGLPDRFILFVGTVEPRKNLLRLLAAFERLAADPGFRHRLVVVGARGWKAEPLMARLDDLAARGLARHLGYVPDDDLAALYPLADLFVFPSLYEGFGIPPLEAMAAGVPVVCSSASSLPEVCGDAAVYFDPGSEDELAEAVRRVLSDPALAADLRARGLRQAAAFSWERTADQLLRYFAAVRAGGGR